MNTPLTPLLPGATPPSRGPQRPPLREELRPFQDQLRREVSRSRDDVPPRESKGRELRETASTDRAESLPDKETPRDDTLKRHSTGSAPPSAQAKQREGDNEADEPAQDELELTGDTSGENLPAEKTPQELEAAVTPLSEVPVVAEPAEALETAATAPASVELSETDPSANLSKQKSAATADDSLPGVSVTGGEESAGANDVVVSAIAAEKTTRESKPPAGPSPPPDVTSTPAPDGATGRPGQGSVDTVAGLEESTEAAASQVANKGAAAAAVAEPSPVVLDGEGAVTASESSDPPAPERTPTPDARGVGATPGSREPNLSTANSQRPDGEQPTPKVDASRFVSRVTRAFEAAEQRGGVVQLRLSPPELGAMRIELSVQQGVLSAHLETETAAAKSLLLDNLPALRERLAAQDIRVERFDVDVRQESTGGQPDWQAQQEARERQFHQGGPHATRGERQVATEAVTASAPVMSPLHSSGRFNALA